MHADELISKGVILATMVKTIIDDDGVIHKVVDANEIENMRGIESAEYERGYVDGINYCTNRLKELTEKHTRALLFEGGE